MDTNIPSLRQPRTPYVVMACIWTLLIGAVFLENQRQERDHAEKINLQTARAAFQQVRTFRLWNATHGGVYVPVTEDTPPNPYLDVPDRDVTTTSGIKLTKVNPAYMTRQASVLSKNNLGVRFHITSLKPINPKNAPYPWEKDWLLAFETGAKERWEMTAGNDNPRFRYMAPLFVKRSCLRCHGKQGYKVGDVRGGISVIFPVSNHGIPHLWWTYALALAAGLVAIGSVFYLHSRQTRSQRRYWLRLNDEMRARIQREQEIAHHQEILNQIHDSVFIFDADTFAIEYVNKSAQWQTGFSPEDFRDITPAHLLPSFTTESFRNLLLPLKSGSTAHLLIETTMRCKEGDVIDIELQAQKIFWGAKKSCYIAIIRDITERNRHIRAQFEMEKRLHEAQRLESIATLAGGITHDFNNLLTIIIGYADLTKEVIKDNPEAAQNMQTLLQACNQAKDLVKQILSFSRSAASEKKPLMLHLMVKESLKMLKKTLPSSITLREHISTTDDIVMADPVQIQQIVMNLCINAFHAMGEAGGTLTVTLRPVEITKDEATISGLEQGNHVRLDIQDTGCGIPADIIDKIFDPYFTTKEKGKGTGLGLAVVYGIVKDMNGHITVDSSPAGTTFTIFLPTVRAAKPRQPGDNDSMIPLGNGERILVVDDNTELVNLVETMLVSLGYAVTARTSPREALAAFAANPDRFDLVITDQIMPGMAGTQLAAEMLRLRDIPIILCTGYSETINEQTFPQHGIQEFIMKPVIKNDLASCVRRVLDRRRGVQNNKG